MLPALLLFVVVAVSVVFFLYTRSLRRAQKEQSQSEERFRQMADHVQEIFWMIDARTKKALYVNQAYAYWDTVRANGNHVRDRWQAPRWVWEWAERQKSAKIEECKLLYGQ